MKTNVLLIHLLDFGEEGLFVDKLDSKMKLKLEDRSNMKMENMTKKLEN